MYIIRINTLYHVKNSGSNSFSWKIIDPKGSTWSNGSSKPGESGTWTAFWDLDSIPVGEYTFIVTSHNGGPGAFDFSARVLDQITTVNVKKKESPELQITRNIHIKYILNI